jgi:methionyl aminopeptidase
MAAIVPANLQTFKAAQDIARSVLADIARYIVPQATERTLHQACHRLMLDHGASGYWGNTPAFVLAGDRLRDSVFDHRYVPADVPLGENEMITIDVGPRIGDCLGDCARSYFLKNGKLVTAQEAGPEQAAGMALEHLLHAEFFARVQPDMSFAEIYRAMDSLVRDSGYENLDLLANYGHSLEKDVADFVLMDGNNGRPLGSVAFFTFEPHIARPGSRVATKLEEVYYFDNESVRML